MDEDDTLVGILGALDLLVGCSGLIDWMFYGIFYGVVLCCVVLYLHRLVGGYIDQARLALSLLCLCFVVLCCGYPRFILDVFIVPIGLILEA